MEVLFAVDLSRNYLRYYLLSLVTAVVLAGVVYLDARSVVPGIEGSPLLTSSALDSLSEVCHCLCLDLLLDVSDNFV